MLKVAIVGCGRIADDHASFIKQIKGCEIVGACDREPLMARQLCERFAVRSYFSDLKRLLDEAKPDVVHVTTPPHSHFEIAKHCLERGCHVYVEKPFTLCEAEARILIETAEKMGLRVTVGHDYQFLHAARRMRSLVQDGFLGGEPVHMEAYFCYPFAKSAYAMALLADKNNWVRSLPGKLLQNTISHGIARISEFLTGDSPQVIAHGFVSPLLKSMGETELVDELRVMITEEKGTTAYFTFSSQMRPSLHQFRIYGSKNGLALDQDQETLITLRGTSYKSYLEKFIPPLTYAKQYVDSAIKNMGLFLKNDFHMKSGMKYLFESFYRSIMEGTPAPIPYREILVNARITDAIFQQLAASPQHRKLSLQQDMATTVFVRG
jgi:predicted dehydrogenase